MYIGFFAYIFFSYFLFISSYLYIHFAKPFSETDGLLKRFFACVNSWDLKCKEEEQKRLAEYEQLLRERELLEEKDLWRKERRRAHALGLRRSELYLMGLAQTRDDYIRIKENYDRRAASYRSQMNSFYKKDSLRMFEGLDVRYDKIIKELYMERSCD